MDGREEGRKGRREKEKGGKEEWKSGGRVRILIQFIFEDLICKLLDNCRFSLSEN